MLLVRGGVAVSSLFKKIFYGISARCCSSVELLLAGHEGGVSKHTCWESSLSLAWLERTC